MGVAELGKSVAARLGLHVSRVARSTEASERGDLLAALGTSMVIDVGANDGGYGRELRAHSRYQGRILSFEPGRQAYERLVRNVRSDPDWTAHHVAVSDHIGTASLVVPDVQSSLASLLPAVSGLAHGAASAGVVREEVAVDTLDHLVLDTLEDRARIHLKIDVQGAEHTVLKGALGVLERTATIECEIALVPMYEGQLGFREMIDAIDDLGFVPVNVHRNYVEPGTGKAYDADVFFVRRA